MGFSFLNNLKPLDLSYKTDVDFWDCFEREKQTTLWPQKCIFFWII